MQHVKTAILCFALALAPVSAFAGAGHDHGHSHETITSDQAVEKATAKVQQMASSGKIDASWSGAVAAGVEQKSFAKGPEWVVTFKNEKVTDPAKQTLYMFFSLDGHYLAANYTGN